MTDLNALVSQDALAISQRITEAARSGDAELLLHWARLLEQDALVRGAKGELTADTGG